jgi:hypothetical protein
MGEDGDGDVERAWPHPGDRFVDEAHELDGVDGRTPGG